MPQITRVALFAVIAVSLTLPGFAAMTASTAEQTATIAFEALPTPVKATMMRASQNHEIATVTRRTTKAKVTYETTVVMGSTPWFIKVASDGELLERANMNEPRPRPTHRARPRITPRPSGAATDGEIVTPREEGTEAQP